MHWRPGLRPGPHWRAHDAPPVPDLLVGWGGDSTSTPTPSHFLGASILAPSALRSSCPPRKPGATADLKLATALRHVNAAYRVCDGLGQNKIVRVGNVHEILGQRRRPFVTSNAFARLSISRFVQQIFAIESLSRPKTEQM